MIIICKFTKYKYFIPYLKISTAEDLIYMFLRNIYNNYKLPEKIISDKDKLFISNFWKLLIARFGINYKFSIIYYLQINKQTERLN